MTEEEDAAVMSEDEEVITAEMKVDKKEKRKGNASRLHQVLKYVSIFVFINIDTLVLHALDVYIHSVTL